MIRDPSRSPAIEFLNVQFETSYRFEEIFFGSTHICICALTWIELPDRLDDPRCFVQVRT